MASDLLSSLIAANDPLAAQMLGGYTGAQLQNSALDPNYGRNEGLFGALAKTLAGFRGGGMLNDAVQQVSAARAANRPELAQVLASDDPYKMVAANPSGYSQQTLAQLLSGQTPGSVAEARKAAADAQLAGLNVAGFKGTSPAPSAGDVSAPAGSISAPANRRVAPISGGSASAPPSSAPASADVSVLGTGRPQPGSDQDVGPAAIAVMPREQQQQALAKMAAAKKAAFVQQIMAARAKMQQGGR